VLTCRPSLEVDVCILHRDAHTLLFEALDQIGRCALGRMLAPSCARRRRSCGQWLDARGRPAAMVGMSKEEAIGLPLSQLNPNELTISLVNRYNNTWPLAIDLVASGRVDVKPLITHHFPLEQTAEALTLSGHVGDSLKAIVHPQQ
jgi:hypothetical protein